MRTCKECIESMPLDDPRTRSGRYGRCGCDYCDKPTYYRELEQLLSPLVAEPEWSKSQWEYVRQLRGMVNHLNNKVTELRSEKKVKGKFTSPF